MANTKKKKKQGKKRPETVAPEPKSRANLIMWLIVAVIIIGGGVVIWQVRKPKTPNTNIADEGRTASCAAIQTFDVPSREHKDGQKIDYPQDPPVGGDHWGSPPPVDDGFYETVIPSESVVHNLEHGQIVIYYPKGDPDTAAKVKTYVSERRSFLVAVPREQPLPGGAKVAWTAWGKSQLCTAFDKDALSRFQDAYANQGPEKVRMS